MPADLAARITSRIEVDGPLRVSEFVEAALYDPLDGFYATGGQAGRRGDFLTAPEVGPLFGAVISKAVDAWWDAAGRPSRFVVAEHGAGPGTLARTVTVAAGACLAAGALEWVMVERSDAQRRSHPSGEHFRSVPSDDELDQVDLVVANELLDNLAFRVVARRVDRWVERRVSVGSAGFTLVDAEPVPAPVGAERAPIGTELPVAESALAWVGRQRERHPRARLLVLDYAASTPELVARGGGWLRSYRGHERVADWLRHPGQCDITIDLPLEPIAAQFTHVRSQADFLGEHGIDELVAEGRAVWEERSAIGDLAALRARSRVTEAAALLDPDAMGGFTVFSREPDER